jgi:glycosyltransferase involved in cell wall biosynthesis
MKDSEMVSVVIPCRNEAKAIVGTVDAILNSDHKNLEVIVVDGMSDDGTRDALSIFANDPRVRIIDNVKKLTPYAFNLGVKAARGDYVQIVGARNGLDPGYIPILLDTLKTRPDVACVGGDYQHVHDSAAGRDISLAMESKFGMGAGNYRTLDGDGYVDTVGIPMYRKSIFEQVGYFDETLTRNQDDEFNFRLRQRGLKIMYVHAAKATYLVRGNLRKAFEQFRQYGYFKVFVNKKHRAVTTVRQVIPALFLAFWSLGLPLALFSPGVRGLLSFTAFIYTGAGLWFAGRKLGLVGRIRVLLTCFVLHMGYGLGYWQGIWDFLVVGRSPRTELQRQTL